MPRASRQSDFPTLADIAAGLEITSRRVSQLKDEGMPVHSVEAALQWRSEKAKENGGNLKDQLTQARIKLVKEQERKIRIENDLARGRMIDRGEVTEMLIRLGTVMNSALGAASQEIPRVCLGLPLEKSIPKAKEKMAEIQRMISDAESEFWKSHPENTDD